jgi:3-deoxy-D-manno-octulosonate 8-phosphate phosphatase KdsC-like HAD superfamily phosphatase
MNNLNFSNITIIFFDFDGVFTDNMVFVDQNGIESVKCNRSDGLGIQKLSEIGIMSMIISTETNNVVNARAKKLKIEFEILYIYRIKTKYL